MISLLLYNTGLLLYRLALGIAAPFHAKAGKFIRGRKQLFKKMEERLATDPRPKVWIHCASLGEFEQGRPVMEAIRKQYPSLSLVLTFFSPSGYEVKKNDAIADHIFYLPLDSKGNAQRFLDIVQPCCALFVKYEFWYHYLSALYRKNIPAILFSAIFQQRHPFFKWYGGLYRKMLGFYQQLFVQDEASLQLLQGIGVSAVQIAGDTRFDRAARILAQDKTFPAVETFKQDHTLIVAGSTWQEDTALLEQALRLLPAHYKLLIAPHETDEAHIDKVKAAFPGQYCLWTDPPESQARSRVCIVHTVGQLAYLYRYADIVWVGGGFTRSGIHNAIEPAVFGKPLFWGPEYSRYREAAELIAAGAAESLATPDALAAALLHKEALLLMGSKAESYVQSQLGATEKIMRYLSEKCLFRIA